MRHDPQVKSDGSEVAIVVACWNHLETTTRPCVESVLVSASVPFRLVCVDNGSTDGTREWLESRAHTDSRVRVVASRENAGWALGSLAGLEHAAGASHLCLLNSDTIVAPGWLELLLEHLEGPDRPAAVIPNERPEPAAGLFGGAWPPTPETVASVAEHVLRALRGRSAPAAPSRFCLLLRAASGGLLREYLRDFDRYWSGELDWQRFWHEHGLTCRVALDTFVFHARGGSGGYDARRPPG